MGGYFASGQQVPRSNVRCISATLVIFMQHYSDKYATLC